jgi:hypothetical protein
MFIDTNIFVIDKHTICVWSRGIKVMILVRRVWRYQRVSVNRRRTDNTMNKRTNDDLQNITWIQFTSYRQKCQLVVRDELNLHPTIGGVYTIASFLKIIIPYYLYTKYNMKRCNKGRVTKYLLLVSVHKEGRLHCI